MAKILLAASAEPTVILRRILKGHDLTVAHTVEAAEHSLKARSFDLIVCTVAFDESQMFEFLRRAKARSVWKRIPFVCARVRPNVIRSPLALEGVAFTCEALGASAFLDIAKFGARPDGKMRKAIEALLPRAAA